MQIQDNPSGADIIRPREAKRLPYNHLSMVLLRIRPWLSQRGGFHKGRRSVDFYCQNVKTMIYYHIVRTKYIYRIKLRKTVRFPYVY